MAFVHPMLVFVTLTIFGTVCAVALWSKQTTNVDINLALDVPQEVSRSIEADVKPSKKQSRKPHHTVVRKNVRPAQLESVVIEQVAVLSSWQSPTDRLLEYPSTALVGSLPELGQSVQELEAYLSSEVKELDK